MSRVHYQGEEGKRVPGRGTSTQGGWKTHVMRKTLEMRQDWIASAVRTVDFILKVTGSF